METLMRSLLHVLLVLAVAVPATASAFDPSNPDDVGLAVFPFEPDREDDRSLAFLLEDYLQANLGRATRHPVYTGRDILPAIPQGTLACIEGDRCLRMLGGQFNVSLVARVQVYRAGPEIQLEVAFYTTGNGILIGRENTAFQTGDERSMVDAFYGWWKLYFDTSLRVSPGNRAGEGGVVGTSAEERERLEDYKSGRKKKVSSRRTDFGEEREPEADFDRSDPTGDLRALVGDDEDDDRDSRSSSRRRADTRRQDAYDVSDDDLDLDSGDDDRNRDRDRDRDRARSRDRDDGDRALPPLYEDDDEIDLEADEDRGGSSVRSYSDAQRAGYGPREYKRYTQSGLTLKGYGKARWEDGGRFYLRAGPFYGGGWLTRRYATIVFVEAGNRKTDEYAWERLGISKYGNPGVTVGFGYAVHKLVAVEADVSFMFAQQDLRREYASREFGTNWSDNPEEAVQPQSKNTLHLVADVRARFFVFPAKKVKLTPGFGVTAMVMQGYDITPEPPLDYSGRPVAGVLGLTPLVGFLAHISPFVAINVDATGTVYIVQGATNYDEHMLADGVTSPHLDPRMKQEPIKPTPIMGRVTATAMFFF